MRLNIGESIIGIVKVSTWSNLVSDWGVKLDSNLCTKLSYGFSSTLDNELLKTIVGELLLKFYCFKSINTFSYDFTLLVFYCLGLFNAILSVFYFLLATT